MAKIIISLSASTVNRSSLWNELAARKKAGKITQTQYNDCIKLLNSNPAKLKDLIAKGLTPAKAATSVIRSVSSVESTSADVTRTAIWNELQKRKKNGKIEQSVFNAAMKALNTDAQGIVKKAKASGITAARAVSNLIRSVSAVESTSAPVVNRSSLWNELARRKKAGKITQAQYSACIKAVNGDPGKLKAWASKGMTAAKAATSLIRSAASE